MPALTRRRDPAAHDETWLIHYDDVHVGTIRMRPGVPTNVDQWGWTIGFYPASHRGLRASGTAKSLEMARGAFETAWRWLLPQITQADFVEYRQYRAHAAWKHAMREAGCKLPTQMPDGRSRCFCGAEIDPGNRNWPDRAGREAALARQCKARCMTFALRFPGAKSGHSLVPAPRLVRRQSA